MTQLSPEEREKLRTSPTEYQALYSRMKDFHLAVSPETGVLFYMLARATEIEFRDLGHGVSAIFTN